MNSAAKVAKYFSEDAEQVNFEMYYFNSAMKYGFGVLENTRSTISVDDNVILIKLSNSIYKIVSDIVTHCGAFPQGK